MQRKFKYVNDYPSIAWLTVFGDGHAIVDFVSDPRTKWFACSQDADEYLRHRGYKRA